MKENFELRVIKWEIHSNYCICSFSCLCYYFLYN